MDNATKISKFALVRNAYPLGGHKTRTLRKHGFEATLGRFEAEGLSARNLKIRPVANRPPAPVFPPAPVATHPYRHPVT